MPIDSVTLTAGVRAGLTSIQRADEQSADRGRALSTGKRVNSVRDDAVAYLAAKALTDQASDLAATKEQSASTVSAVGVALDGARAVESLVDQLQGIALAGQGTASATERAAFAEQYNTVRAQIDQVAGDASFQGSSLLTGGTTLSAGDVTVSAQNVTAGALGLSAAAADGSNFGDALLAEISAAATQIHRSQANLGSSVSALTIQADNADNLRNVAAEAGLKLTEADLQEEAAALAASRTRQQLASAGLAIGRDQQNSILSLF
jgi:flagellin